MGGIGKVFIVVLAIGALVAGYMLSSTLVSDGSSGPPQTTFQGLHVYPPRHIAVPELVKDDGSALTEADLKGDWTLVFFGYTNCPDICPATMSVLAAAKKESEGDFPKVLMVSVDPERDAVDMLGEYVDYFDPEFTGITGSEQMLNALALQMSVVFGKVPSESGKESDYLVDHSSSVLAINPDGALAAILRAPHTPASINDSVEKLTRGS